MPIYRSNIANDLDFNISATIPNGQAMSGAIDLMDLLSIGIFAPAAWTAAALTFLSAPTLNGAYGPIYDDAGIEVSAVVTAGAPIALDSIMGKLSPWRYIKLRSGTNATPVNQAADRVFTVTGKA